MLKYRSSIINKFLNKLKEIKIGKFNSNVVFREEIAENSIKN